MDIAEIFEALEWFSQEFPKLENRFIFEQDGRKARISTGFRFEELLVVMIITKGQRGGLGEHVWVVDPAQTVVADRLVIHYSLEGWVHSAYAWVKLLELKKDMRSSSEKFDVIATPYLRRAVARTKEDPEKFRTTFSHPPELSGSRGQSIGGYHSVNTIKIGRQYS